MGQSVAGAATSGQGFKGDQITSAIIAALLSATNSNDKMRKRQQQRAALGMSSSQSPTMSAPPPPPGAGGGGASPYQQQQPLLCASEILKTSDYSKERATAFHYVAPERNAAHTVEVNEYAPEVFHMLRELGGTSDEAFIDEWDIYPQATAAVMRAMNRQLSEEQMRQLSGNKGGGGDGDAGLELGEGRSMALFLKSKSMAFMCKTISETEVVVLVSILKKYLQHIETNPDSMLMRFVMLLRVTVNSNVYEVPSRAAYDKLTPLTDRDFGGAKPKSRQSEVGYVLVFNDCFSNCDVLHERWDLKGRHPKPGKFRHFPSHQLYRNRVVQPKVKQHADEQQSIFGGGGGDGGMGGGGGGGSRGRNANDFSQLDDERRQQADLSSEDEMGDDGEQQNLRADKTLEGMRLNTRKDKDLARLFWLEPADRQYLIRQITADFKFLLDCGLMDYSILIGVRYNTPEEQYEKETSRRKELRRHNNNTNKNPNVYDSLSIGGSGRQTQQQQQQGFHSIVTPNHYNHNGQQFPHNGSRQQQQLWSASSGGALRSPRGSMHLNAMKMPFVMGEEDNAGIIEVRPASPNAQTNRRHTRTALSPVTSASSQALYGHSQQQYPQQQPYAHNNDQQQHPNDDMGSNYSEEEERQLDGGFDEFHSQFHQGVDSVECVETYYIGIIDMLTVYNGKKKVANFCKKCLWQENTLSTVPPSVYAERIEKYSHRIFPKVAIEYNDGTLQPQMQSLLIGRGKVSTHASGFKVARETRDDKEFLMAPTRK